LLEEVNSMLLRLRSPRFVVALAVLVLLAAILLLLTGEAPGMPGSGCPPRC
jgi:hypothetical protein